MKRIARAIDTAFAYFSIVPRPRTEAAAAPDADALVALPVVGAAIGAVSGAAAWLVSRVAPRPYAVPTAFALPILLSGALHFDGFLDCSDAAFASVTPWQRLQILKDPHRGSYAIAGATLLATCWNVVLRECRPSALCKLLAFSGALTRLAAVSNSAWLPYARPQAVTRAFSKRPSRRWLLAEALVLAAFALSIAPLVWLVVPVAFALSATLAYRLSIRFGGGLTGDAYGFLIVVLEPAIVAAAIALERRGPGES